MIVLNYRSSVITGFRSPK